MFQHGMISLKLRSGILLNLFRKHWLKILIPVLILGSHWAWFTFTTHSYGDTWYESKQTISEYLGAFERSSWLSSRNFGQPNSEPYFYPFYLIRGLFSLVGLYYEVSISFVYYFPIIFLAPVGMYYLARRLHLDPDLAVLASGIYSLNSYFLVVQAEHLAIASGFASAPLGFYLIWKLLEARFNMPRLILTSIYLTYSFILEPRIFFLGLPIYLFILATVKQLRFDKIKKISLVTLFAGLLCAYWIFTVMNTGSSGISELVSRSLFGSQYQSLQTAATLMHPSWTGAKPVPFTLQHIPIYFWILPLIILCGFALNGTKNRNHIALLLLGVAGIFLVKQSNPPISWIYEWLYQNLPGFSFYRESSKFYLYIALSYALLVPFAIHKLTKYPNQKYGSKILTKYLSTLALIAAVIVLGLNALPLINGSFGTQLAIRHINNEYKQINSSINENTSTYRTAWIPGPSRWIENTNLHPVVNLLAAIQGQFAQLSNQDIATDRILAYRINLEKFMQSDVSGPLMAAANIKYVGIPMIDRANDEDPFKGFGGDEQYYIDLLERVKWLKKSKISTEHIHIYENPNVLPYIYASDSLTKISNVTEINELYPLITNITEKKDLSITGDDNPSINTKLPLVTVRKLLTGSAPAIVGNRFTISQKLAQDERVLLENEKPKYSFQVNQGELKLTKSSNSTISINNKIVANPVKQPLTDFKMKPNFSYVISNGDELIPVDKVNTTERNFGEKKGEINVYQVEQVEPAFDQNLVNNGWNHSKADCLTESDKTSADIKIIDTEINKKITEITTSKTTACVVSNDFPVKGEASYKLDAEFMLHGTQYASYEIIFDDPNNTTIARNTIHSADRWAQINELITVPAGTHMAKIVLKARPDDFLRATSSTKFMNVKIQKLKQESTDLGTFENTKFTDLGVYGPDKITLDIVDSTVNGRNLIENGGFETGLWQQNVGDCNAFDDKPDLRMKISSDQTGGTGKVIELGATHHTACTADNDIPVDENGEYLFSFDHASPTMSNIGYQLIFNDGKGTIIGEVKPALAAGWATYQKKITAPFGATKVNLVIYSYSDGLTNIEQIAKYDNFKLVKIPDRFGQVYAASVTQSVIKKPKSITFEKLKPALSTIKIDGATTSFYINMAETYHPKWRLTVNNAKNQGLNSWVPWAKPDVIPDSDHFKLNDFANGWYIDVDKLCKEQQLCTLNADGTYDLELVAEFTPQRWFYVGLIISGTTLAGCLGYLGFVGWRKLRRRRGSGGSRPRGHGDKPVGAAPKRPRSRVVRL